MEYTWAEIQAKEIVKLFNIEYPFNIYEFCKSLDIKIVEEDLKNDGYLLCENGFKCIGLKKSISNVNRKKFIVGHELGHYFMHGKELTFACSNINEVFNKYKVIEDSEKEANEFASEILIPKEKLASMLPEYSMKFRDISDIANMFNVSLTATAIKCIENSKTENEVLLYYKNNSLKWFASSSIYVGRTNSIPPTGSLASEFYSEGSVANRYKESKDIWKFMNGEVFEEIIPVTQNEILIKVSYK